jgi:D-galactarolactone cycloisomerase
LADDEGQIVAVEARVYRCAVDEPFGYSQGIITHRESAVARVETANGTVGWGEAYGLADPAAAAIAMLGSPLVGQSVLSRTAAARSLIAGDRSPHTADALAGARSALALAMTDAAARLLGLPVRALLGGMADPPLRPYASALWFRPEDDPTAHYPAALAQVQEVGFTAVKAKIGLGVEEDLRALRRLRPRDADLAIMVDANRAYDRPTASRIVEAMVEGEFLWLEEPLPATCLDDYAWLRSHSAVQIAGGESVISFPDALPWLDRAAVDVVQPDICLAGGFEAVIPASEVATARGAVSAPHCFGLGIGLAASLHWASLIAGTGSPAVWIEVDSAPHPARDLLLAGCDWFRQGGADLSVPREPGLGVDPARIEAYRVR